jgi:aldose 1-epimerase
MNATLAVLLLPMASLAQGYKAEQVVDHEVPIVRLTDAAHGVEVSMAPGIGNRAYEMKVHGKNISTFRLPMWANFRSGPDSPAYRFWPWADLMSEQAFWANGKKYTFNMELGNVRGNMPSHGLLVNSPLWKVTRVAADAKSAYVTSRLEFWKYPDLVHSGRSRTTTR